MLIRGNECVIQMQGFHNFSLGFIFNIINLPLFPLPTISHLLINDSKKKHLKFQKYRGH
jgi:hypothetical protein